MGTSEQNQESEQDQEQEDRSGRRRSGRSERGQSQQQGLVETVDEGRSKYIEAITQAYQDKQARIGRAWSEYTTEANEIVSRVFKACIDSYNDYVNEFAKLPPNPDEEAMRPVQSAWAEHVKACQQSPETTKAMFDAEHKLVTAIVEAEKACQDAAHSAISEYTSTVDSALSDSGLFRIDAEQAQLVASEIIARSI